MTNTIKENQETKNTNPFQSVYISHEKRQDVVIEKSKLSKLLHVLLMIVVFGICFLIPLFGIMFYALWKHERPKDAKWPGIAMILGFAVNITIWLFTVFSTGLIF